MPVNYTPEEVANAMKQLVENLGDTYWVSRETGISERTLRRWKSRFQINATLTSDEPQSRQEKLIYDRYRNIRDNLLTHIERLYQQMDTKPEEAAELAIALARLIDRLTKLESLLDNRHFSIVVSFDEKPPEEEDELPF
jgi:DNA-binding transcriptional MerR regulator